MIKSKQEVIEETLENFMSRYFWFDQRIAGMEFEHRSAVGVLLEQHPEILFHLKEIFDRNLTESGCEMKEEGVWTVTREEQVLLGFMAIPRDGDELVITNYKKSSGILGLDGVEFDSTIKTSK